MLSLSMGTHGLRILRDFFRKSLGFFKKIFVFSDRNGLNVYSVLFTIDM